MPAKTPEQQRLFGMAYAVRAGDMQRSDVSDQVLKIVDSDMTDEQIRDFAATKHSDMQNLSEYLNEHLA